jgi:hypothetical protein
MQGFLDLASQQQQRFWVYTSKGVSNSFQTWSKPPGISFVHIITIGAGAGGSSGLGTNTTAGSLGGGGGGGSGGMTNVFLPAHLIPDILHINIGLGGAGGAPTTSTTVRGTGVAGTGTYVGYYPNQGAGYTICFAAGGSAGNTGGTGGTGGSTAGTTNIPVSQIGLRNYIAGQNGTQGTISSGATSLTAVYRITGGMGAWGGGTIGPTFSPGSEYSLLTYLPQADPTLPGAGGMSNLLKFIFTTGMPPRSTTGSSAVEAGNSAFGCGGPGGASGNPNSGAGGRGGDGLVILTCG